MSVGAVNKQTGERIPTAGMPAVDSVLSGTSTNPVQNRVVKAALDRKTDTDMVAADFNAGTSYTAGNYCIYEGKFYKFKNSHSGAWSAADVDEIKIAGELSSLKSGFINVNTISNQCSFDVNSIRATFNAQSKVVSFDVRSNDGFTASTWTALLTITDATLAPSVAMYFPVVFINANRDDVVGHGVGKLDTSNIISVCPDDTIPAYTEAVGLVMWQ